MKPYLEEKLVSVSFWNRNRKPCQIDQWYFPVSQLKTRSQKLDLNDILSAYSSIYLKLEDYETKNKICGDTEYEWKKIVTVLILTSSHNQVPW